MSLAHLRDAFAEVILFLISMLVPQILATFPWAMVRQHRRAPLLGGAYRWVRVTCARGIPHEQVRNHWSVIFPGMMACVSAGMVLALAALLRSPSYLKPQYIEAVTVFLLTWGFFGLLRRWISLLHRARKLARRFRKVGAVRHRPR